MTQHVNHTCVLVFFNQSSFWVLLILSIFTNTEWPRKRMLNVVGGEEDGDGGNGIVILHLLSLL